MAASKKNCPILLRAVLETGGNNFQIDIIEYIK